MIIVVCLIMGPMSIKCKTKVGNLEVACPQLAFKSSHYHNEGHTRCRDEEVVRLDISMYPTKSVRFFDTENHLGDVPLSDSF